MMTKLQANDSMEFKDAEAAESQRFHNDVVSSFSWSNCSHYVKDRTTKEQRAILSDATGIARAGLYS